MSRLYLVGMMNYRTVKKVHQLMVRSVLRAPVNLFFDVTPTGTILNRFSRDLDTVDNFHWIIMWTT